MGRLVWLSAALVIGTACAGDGDDKDGTATGSDTESTESEASATEVDATDSESETAPSATESETETDLETETETDTDSESETDTEDEPRADCGRGVAFTDAKGGVTDVTASFTGKAGAPALVVWTDDGTLAFCAGTHHVRISVDDGVTVTLQGESADTTTLDGSSKGTLLGVQDGAVVEVDGLTLTGGTTGVKSSGTVTVTLTDSVVTGNNNTSTYATGIRLTGTLTLDGTQVTDNHASYSSSWSTTCYGGGLYLAGSLTMTDSTLSDNSLTCTISGPTYTSSVAYGGGGMVTGDATLSNSTLADNTLSVPTSGGYAEGLGGGLFVVGSFEATDSTVSGNTIDNTLYCGSANNCTVYAMGAGVRANAIALDNTVVEGNVVTVLHEQYYTLPATTYARGGGLYAGGEVTFTDSTLTDNVVDASKSTADTVEAEGGALYWGASSGTLTITDSDLGTAGSDDNAPDDVAGAVDLTQDGVTTASCDATKGTC